MDIFDIEPSLPSVPADCGPEPSLRQVLIHYYSQCFDMDRAAKHADLYIESLNAKIKH